MIVNEGKTLEIGHDWKEHAYYNRADHDDWMEPFWRSQSTFRRLFERLDTRVVIELACGHGRHTAYLLHSEIPSNKIERVYLIDINEENIEFCKKRFVDLDFVFTAINNGYDLKPIQNESVSAIFCYDAMVHFEYDAVISYLIDALRVLVPGGRALFHHSNYDRSPGADYSSNPSGRNFMSKNLFAHIARRAGFKILAQSPINWGMVRNLDCISLIEKPEGADIAVFNSQKPRELLIKRLFMAPPSAICKAALRKCRLQ